MAQTNVIVTYAPERRAIAPVMVRDPIRERRSGKRWSATLAGALLAGGAVFALGQFVRPDGSSREAGFPARPAPPLAQTGPPTAPNRAAPSPEATPGGARPSPLPYIALVRHAAPSPKPSETARRPLSAPAARDATRPSRKPATPIAASPNPGDDRPADAFALAPPPVAPEAATGQRRDLEGFLGERGLVLAAPAAPGEGTTPVAERTPGGLAAAEDMEPGPAVVPASAMAAAEAVAPAPATPGLGQTPAAPDGDAAIATADLTDATTSLEAETISAAGRSSLVDLEPVGEPAPATGGREQSAAAETTRELTIAPVPVQPRAGPVAGSDVAYTQHFPMAVVNGEPLGAVTLRDLGPQGQAVHLGALVGLLKLRMPEAEFTRLSNAAAADQFVTLDQLRAAGITVQFDPRQSRLLIDAR